MYKFCYIGRLTQRQKRSDLLVKFYESLKESNIEFCIDIYGDGEINIKDQLQGLPNVVYHGYTNDWVEYLDNSYIFLSFSDYEGCPLSLLEFSKYIGNKFLAKRANGIKQYLSSNCLFNTIEEATSLILQGASLENNLTHDEYFCDELSRKQINWLIENVFKK